LTKELFNTIFDNEIRPFINEIQSNHSQIKIKNLELCKQNIYKQYIILNNAYKENIFDQSEGSLLDRHKVASCICGAFLKVSVFNKAEMIKEIKKSHLKVFSYFYYVNEFVALYAANKFLSFFMVMDYKDDLEKKRVIIEHFPKMPETTRCKTGFWTNVLFNLSQIKDEQQIGLAHYDLYSYAMFFYMLESFFVLKMNEGSKAKINAL